MSPFLKTERNDEVSIAAGEAKSTKPKLNQNPSCFIGEKGVWALILVLHDTIKNRIINFSFIVNSLLIKWF